MQSDASADIKVRNIATRISCGCSPIIMMSENSLQWRTKQEHGIPLLAWNPPSCSSSRLDPTKYSASRALVHCFANQRTNIPRHRCIIARLRGAAAPLSELCQWLCAVRFSIALLICRPRQKLFCTRYHQLLCALFEICFHPTQYTSFCFRPMTGDHS